MGRKAIWFTLFVTAMAYLESAVVVYLRAIYYPDGFAFPLIIIPDRMALIEVGREVATIVMLGAVGWLAGSDRWERFLWFCLAFGVWDVQYYAWLYLLLGWPPSLLTWDVLFLIPVPWIGPVLAPLLVAAAMTIAPIWLLRLKARGAEIRFRPWQWALAIAGGLLCILAFTIDFRVTLRGEMPPPFRWWIFLTGFGLGIAPLAAGIRGLRRPGEHRSGAHPRGR